MKNRSVIKLIATTLIGFVLAFPASAVPVTDLTKKCTPLIDKNQKIDKPPLRGMPEKAHKRLTRALELIADEQYKEGIEGLKSLFESSSDEYVKSVVSMNIASAYAQQDDYKSALPYFEKALQFGQGNLDHDRLQALRQNIASLFYGIGKKQEALDIMNVWLKKSLVDDPKSYVLIAVLYTELGKYREALCPAYYAVKTQSKPKKQYHNLLLVTHYELKDIEGSAIILKDMVQTFPEEKSYWRQLSSLYMSMDKIHEALALMEMLYLNGGFENESDYKTLASLFAYEEVPYRSAKILEEGVTKGVVKSEEKNWRQIASSYRISKEIDKAIVAYGKTAEMAKDGEEYLTQAELYFEKEKWRDSITSLEKALDKGVEDVGRAYFTKGSALASLGQCKNAISSLETATKYQKWRTRANAWIDYINDRLKHDKC